MLTFFIIWVIVLFIVTIVFGFFQMSVFLGMKDALEKEGINLGYIRLSLYYQYFYLFKFIRKLQLDKEKENKLLSIYEDMQSFHRYGLIFFPIWLIVLFVSLIIFW